MISSLGKMTPRDISIIGIMLIPIVVMLAAESLNGFEGFLVLILPIPVGLFLAWRLSKNGKKFLGWFCLFTGLVPFGMLAITLLGIQMGWWNE